MRGGETENLIGDDIFEYVGIVRNTLMYKNGKNEIIVVSELGNYQKRDGRLSLKRVRFFLHIKSGHTFDLYWASNYQVSGNSLLDRKLSRNYNYDYDYN